MQLFAVNFIPLPCYSTCFERFTHPSSGLQLYLQPPVLLEAVDTVEIVLLMMGV